MATRTQLTRRATAAAHNAKVIGDGGRRLNVIFDARTAFMLASLTSCCTAKALLSRLIAAEYMSNLHNTVASHGLCRIDNPQIAQSRADRAKPLSTRA